MKKYLMLLLSSAAVSHAAVVQFDLSPAGTDNAVGLSPANETAVVNSTGSGNEILTGISFDTDSSVLSFAIGYGSSAGFTDLTAPATVMHIHGPAPTNVAAGVLIDLAPYHFVFASDATKGGVIIGSATFDSTQASNLLAGLTYVNIHTTNYPPGEIRGQFIPAVASNSAPVVACAPSATVECTGDPINVTSQVSDPDGDALTVYWSVNGTFVQTNTLAAGSTSTPVAVTLPANLSVGTNEIATTVVDSGTNTTSCSTTIIVQDTTAPVINGTSVNPSVLWPPNHKMVPITVRVRAEDGCGEASWKIVSVSSSEPENGQGDGDTAPDWEIIGDKGLKLRAERSGKNKAGRVYSIVVQATDAAGNTSETKTLKVIVPHSKGGQIWVEPKPKKNNNGNNGNNGNANGHTKK